MAERPLSRINEGEHNGWEKLTGKQDESRFIKRRLTLHEQSQHFPRARRDSDLNLESNKAKFLQRRNTGVGLNTAERLTRRASRRESTMERQNTRRGSIFSVAGQTEKSFESRRTSIVGGRRVTLVPTEFGFVSERRASQLYRKSSRFQGDGKTFSGLPMAFYVPKSEIQQIPNYENNYRMTPKRLFNVKDVRPKIEKTVNLFLSKYYIRSDAVQSVQTMCDHVKEELKRFKFYRYRYVVSGYILEQGDQGVSVASKSLMDENYDRFFTVTAENFHTIVVCSVHAIYLS